MKKTLDDFVMGRATTIQPDARELLIFAAKEAYCHIRGCSPDCAEDDEFAAESRSAFFVCEALLSAIDKAGDSEFVKRARA